MLEKEIQDLQTTAKWAEDYINEFLANNEFDPFSILINAESSQQKLYVECVYFLQDISETIVEKCEEHKERINAILRG